MATAATSVPGEIGHAAEPELLGMGAETWVYISVSIFLLLAVFVGKLPQRITGALDARIAEARRQLDEAKAVRSEAEALLASAQQQQADAARDAAAILDRAHTEAAQLVADAQTGLATTITRRTRMAEDKIGAAQRSAEADLRARAVDLATAQARRVLADTDGDVQHRLIDTAIAELDRR